MRKIFTLICLVGFWAQGLAQSSEWVWAKRIGGIQYDGNFDIVLDNSNNIFITGFFDDTVDFDPGPGIFNLISQGNDAAFICKLDSSGNFLWAKSFGGTSGSGCIGRSLRVDSAGNIFITGSFSGTVDFDPGPGVFNLAVGEIFILKLNASGDFIWAKRITDASSYQMVNGGLALDESSNVYLTGDFRGLTDFDPGPGTFNLNVAGLDDIFILKLDSSGNFKWAKRIGSGAADEGYDIAVDIHGNVYTTGDYQGTVDFDPGPAVFNLFGPGNAVFISKLDSSGNFMMAKAFNGGSVGATGRSIGLDGLGNIYTSGSFNLSYDFDPGPAVYNLTSFSGFDVFVSKLDSSGNFIWAKSFSGVGSDYNTMLTVDVSGNVYSTGGLGGSSTDFDPGPGTFVLGYGAYISKLDSSGNFVWAKSLGDGGIYLAHDALDNLYLAGTFFTPSITLGPTTLFNNGSWGDIFVAKMSDSRLLSVYNFQPDSVCENFPDTIFWLLVDTVSVGTYEVEISDSTGSFVSPFVLNQFTISTPQNYGYSALNLNNIPSGSCYRFRVNRITASVITGSPSDCFKILECPGRINITSISTDSICQNFSVTLNWNLTDTISVGTYEVEISDSTGSFASPIVMSQFNITSTQYSGSVVLNIIGFPPGNCYRFRVNRVTAPAITGNPGSICLHVLYCPSTISIDSISTTSTCPNTSVGVYWSISDTLITGTYRIELSDGTGNFSSPYNCGQFNVTAPQTFGLTFANIPNVPAASCYEMRIKRITAPVLISDTSVCISMLSCPNWIYTQQPVTTMDTNAVCAGSVVDVPFNAYGAYLVENIFTVELIAGGNLTSPVSIGSLQEYYSGIIKAQIPDTISEGCNYYLRVIANAPASGPVPVLGTLWGPFCIQHCDIYFNNLQDITACLIPSNQQTTQNLPVVIHHYNNNMIYSAGNEFKTQLLNTTSFLQVGALGALGSVSATSDTILLLTVPPLAQLQSLGINPGYYYLRIVATQANFQDSAFSNMVRLNIGAPADTVSFSALSLPANLPLTDTVCLGDNAYFFSNNLSPNSTYSWITSYGNTTFPSIGLTFTVPGPFYIHLEENNFGCIALSPADTFYVFGTQPSVTIIGPSDVCIGDTIHYYVQFSPGATYQWSSFGGIISSINNQHAWITFPTSGSDTIMITATNMCFHDSSGKIVSVFPLPQTPSIIQSSDTLICIDGGGVSYKWYLNGVLQTQYNTQSITITAAENGNWYVEVSSTTVPYCSSVSAVIQTDVGMEELMSGGGFFVFPNPATNELTAWSSEFGDKMEIEIYDVFGQLVILQPQTTNHKPQTTIDISSLPNGIYFIQLKTKEKIFSQKIIISR